MKIQLSPDFTIDALDFVGAKGTGYGCCRVTVKTGPKTTAQIEIEGDAASVYQKVREVVA